MLKEPPLEKKPQPNLSPAPLRKKLSPARRTLLIAGFSVPVVLMLIAGTVFVVSQLKASHAANLNQNCTLVVPANPLTAQGLATPYQLKATDPAAGLCNEANAGQAAFVQGAVLDPFKGTISVYNPLVIDAGTQPAAAPVVPQLPQGAIVALWFGFNGNTLALQDTNGSLRAGRCVTGLNGSAFGQFSYCNAPQFFLAANFDIHGGRIKPPALGMAKDGQPCPSIRSFSIVDQDQSDNVTTQYLITANGQSAQMNAANARALANAQAQANGSDNRLLDVAVDGALGCSPWKVPDLADPGNMATALPLNELQAAMFQQQPIALVPLGDPMTLVNNQESLQKTNLYRAGVNQQPAFSQAQASTTTYCRNLLNIAPARFQLDAQFTKQRPSADPAAANSLFTFLAQRFVATYEQNLNCQQLLNQPDPVKVTTDGNGVAIDAAITVPTGTVGGGTTTGPLNCNVDGTTVANCTGQTMINGEPCRLIENKGGNHVFAFCTRSHQDRAQAQNNMPAQFQNMNVNQINANQADQVVNNQQNANQQNANKQNTPACFVNFQFIANCAGTAMVNGKTVTLALNQNIVTFTSSTAQTVAPAATTVVPTETAVTPPQNNNNQQNAMPTATPVTPTATPMTPQNNNQNNNQQNTTTTGNGN